MLSSNWVLWSLDVWGNETEGFEVNDRCCLSRSFQIDHLDPTDDNPSDLDIKTALIAGGYLREGYGIKCDGDDRFVSVDLARNNNPLFTLDRNQDK